jgi:hypothetical protein
MRYLFVPICLFMLLFTACSVPIAPQLQDSLEPEANYWQQLGSSLGAGSASSLVQTSSGVLLNAYFAFDGTSRNVYVKEWNGSS